MTNCLFKALKLEWHAWCTVIMLIVHLTSADWEIWLNSAVIPYPGDDWRQFRHTWSWQASRNIQSRWSLLCSSSLLSILFKISFILVINMKVNTEHNIIRPWGEKKKPQLWEIDTIKIPNSTTGAPVITRPLALWWPALLPASSAAVLISHSYGFLL